MAETAPAINPGETPAKREDGMPVGQPFEPGNKLGKLGGRPPGLERRVREIVGDNGELLVQIMVDHATGWRFLVNPALAEVEGFDMAAARAEQGNWEKVSPSDQQAAIRWLADRGFGKVKEFVTIETPIEAGGDLAALAAAVRSEVGDIAAKRREREAQAATA